MSGYKKLNGSDFRILTFGASMPPSDGGIIPRKIMAYAVPPRVIVCNVREHAMSAGLLGKENL